MTKEQFLKIAEQKFEEISQLDTASDNLYDLEKGLDQIIVELGRTTLQGVVGEETTKDRRKKKRSSVASAK